MIRLGQLIKRIEEGRQKMKTLKGKNVVCVLGSYKDGKSTLCNALI